MFFSVTAFAIVEDVILLLFNKIDRQTIAGHFGFQQILETFVKRIEIAYSAVAIHRQQCIAYFQAALMINRTGLEERKIA